MNAEDGDHEGEGSAIDDQAEASDHEPGEDEADDVVLPLGRQPAQRLLQYLHVLGMIWILNLLFTLSSNLYSCSSYQIQNHTTTTVLSLPQVVCPARCS